MRPVCCGRTANDRHGCGTNIVDTSNKRGRTVQQEASFRPTRLLACFGEFSAFSPTTPNPEVLTTPTSSRTLSLHRIWRNGAETTCWIGGTKLPLLVTLTLQDHLFSVGEWQRERQGRRTAESSFVPLGARGVLRSTWPSSVSSRSGRGLAGIDIPIALTASLELWRTFEAARIRRTLRRCYPGSPPFRRRCLQNAPPLKKSSLT